MQVPELRHPGYTPRRTGSLASYERVLARAGFTPVAGIDEAGRGACAGPLVVAAVALNPAKLSRLSLIADSKVLTAAVREQAYDEVMSVALAWHVIVIPSAEIDSCGLHVCNLAGMRRALAGLACRPAYVLTDGFPVRGLGVPALAMWKGDEVAACVAAASVVAKVTRDRMMRELHTRYPQYDFARHKGYATRGHMKALNAHGPCPEHRVSFVNVGSLLVEAGGRLAAEVDDQLAQADDQLAEVGGRFGVAGVPGAAGDKPPGTAGDGAPGAAEDGEVLTGSGAGPGSHEDAAASRLGAAQRARPDREEVLVEVGRLPLADADQEN
jgi:ribonuclease HII